MLKTLDKMVLSASGWRGVFAADGDEESVSKEITDDLRIVVAAAAWVFADYLDVSDVRCVLVGTDTRPTGSAIAAVVIRMLLAKGCAVRFSGTVAAPEIMAAARRRKNDDALGDGDAPVPASGFIYISASHNPVGHNGIKFGLTDGGVLSADAATGLAGALRDLLGQPDARARIESLLGKADESAVQAVYARSDAEKKYALARYHHFMHEVWTNGNSAIADAVQGGMRIVPVGIVADLNGSARTASIDRNFFQEMGIPFKVLNGETGKIAHRIVPEGESLVPCCRLLEDAHRADPAFVLGYVCDCDGDRGNLVIWDEAAGAARPLLAQEVFALSVVAELAHLSWENKGAVPRKTSVAINDATSMRVDAIARIFNARAFHAEVGEAHVVALARKLRETGWTVRILGEGAAGGNITHPSAVRDPLATVMALVKLLAIRSGAKGGLYELWCGLSGQPYRADFTVSDITRSLPPFVTTSSYEPDAILRIKTEDHTLLKKRYQQIFEREWETRKDDLSAKYGIVAYEAWAFKGTEVIRSCRDFGIAGRGGLRIMFYRDRRGGNDSNSAFGFIWMRGSGTEKAFRIMADVQGTDAAAEREFLAWQTRMVLEADASCTTEP
ncbi:MAG: phosphatidylglycerol lysyltransferase [Spirochaetaceae bacterium]|jgi:phosphoglucomutase|nr:phosphatidylglycerol lysyltransferase [Spirochaetaceae bacterium]